MKPISPSALNTFDDCPRKWGWQYIAGIRPAPNVSAAFGQAVHAQIERYYLEGVPFDLRTPEGETALAGHHLLPARGPEVEVEREFSLIWEGVVFGGRKDLELPGIVIDHKTTKDLRWAKSVEDLANGYQSVIYGVEHMVRTGRERVALRWIYYRSRAPHRAQAVDLTIGLRDQATQYTMQRAAERGRVMLRLLEERPDPRDLPYSGDACAAYGGCPHAHLCNLTPGERLRSIMTNEEMLAKIAARVNPPSPAESVPSPAAATASPADAAPSLPLPPGFVWGRGANGAWAAFPAALAPKVPAPAPVVEVPAPVVEAPAPVVEAPAPAPVVEAPAPAPVVEAVEAPTTAARRRGRPPKAPAPVVDNPAPVVEAPAAEVVIEETEADDLPPEGIEIEEATAKPEAPMTEAELWRSGHALAFQALRTLVDAAETYAEIHLLRVSAGKR